MGTDLWQFVIVLLNEGSNNMYSYVMFGERDADIVLDSLELLEISWSWWARRRRREKERFRMI